MSSVRMAWAVFLAAAALKAQPLTNRNLQAPFCYVPGGERSWPVLESPLPSGTGLRVTAPAGVALRARISGNLLQIESRDKSDREVVRLVLQAVREGRAVQSQTIEVRPAPPVRPIAYYADFADDLINIFGIGVGAAPSGLHHQLREGGTPAGQPGTRDAAGLVTFDKAGFDQYFRRLQCQGVAREILWLLPFPLVTSADAHDSRDWDEFIEQGKALLRSPELRSMTLAAKEHLSWGWIRDLIAFRLDRAMHRALSSSALAHGISLAVSFRPFETAVSKYYEIPAFDEDGKFLWFYRPLAPPYANAHPERAGFAHYRELLRQAGRAPDGEPARIEFRNVLNAEAFAERYRSHGDNFRLSASPFAPIQPDSFVLVRRRSGAYDLTRWNTIRSKAEARRTPIEGLRLEVESGVVRLTGVRLPIDAPFLIIENPSGEAPLELDSRAPVQLHNRAGVELGRNAVYFSWPETSEERKSTRTGGITASGGYHPAFFATEAAVRLAERSGATLPLRDVALVIDRGERFSAEMVDFNLRTARQSALRLIRGTMDYPAFRSIYVNTRSHTQLAGNRREGRHLGIDLAYAPLSVAFSRLSTAGMVSSQPEEWTGECQSDDCPHPWRLARNRAIAAGVRSLIEDVRKAFPAASVDVVLPENALVSRELARFQRTQPAGAVSHTAGRYNYIQNIGEGMAMIDPASVGARPVLLGTGAFVSPAVLDRYLDLALAALPRAAQPAAIMYEGQYGLKDERGRTARESALCRMLASKQKIGEVILYEAADWAYRLPWDGFDFLDRCPNAE